MFSWLPVTVRGGEGGDKLVVESPESKLETVRALLAFDGGSGAGVGNSNDADHFMLVNTGDTAVDDVLNVTRFVVEVESMGLDLDSSSWAPDNSYWINFRSATSGTFTLEVFDPVTNNTTVNDVAYPITESELEIVIQDMIIPAERNETCGSIGNSECTDAVKVWSIGNDAFIVFFVGERLRDGVTLNVTEKALSNFVPEYFQNVTNDFLHQNSDVLYTNVEVLDIFMGEMDTVLNIRGKWEVLLAGKCVTLVQSC